MGRVWGYQTISHVEVREALWVVAEDTSSCCAEPESAIRSVGHRNEAAGAAEIQNIGFGKMDEIRTIEARDARATGDPEISVAIDLQAVRACEKTLPQRANELAVCVELDDRLRTAIQYPEMPLGIESHTGRGPHGRAGWKR